MLECAFPLARFGVLAFLKSSKPFSAYAPENIRTNYDSPFALPRVTKRMQPSGTASLGGRRVKSEE